MLQNKRKNHPGVFWTDVEVIRQVVVIVSLIPIFQKINNLLLFLMLWLSLSKYFIENKRIKPTYENLKLSPYYLAQTYI